MTFSTEIALETTRRESTKTQFINNDLKQDSRNCNPYFCRSFHAAT
jgi:hypothetical protein